MHSVKPFVLLVIEPCPEIQHPHPPAASLPGVALPAHAHRGSGGLPPVGTGSWGSRVGPRRWGEAVAENSPAMNQTLCRVYIKGCFFSTACAW